jgi:hypothetical protein
METENYNSTVAYASNSQEDEEATNVDPQDTAQTPTLTLEFLQLPLEIRQQIFVRALGNLKYVNGRTLEDYVTNKLGGLPPICQTNSRIRAEAFGAFLRSSTINFTSYPRPNVEEINRYIRAYDLRLDFWHNVHQAHIVLRFPGQPYQEPSKGRLYQLLQAASSLKYLELTFSGWPHIPSGSALLNAMGANETMKLLDSRPKLQEVKFIWTVNAPGWAYKPNVEDLWADKYRWEEAATQVQKAFVQQGIQAKVTPWIESADRRLWGDVFTPNGLA